MNDDDDDDDDDDDEGTYEWWWWWWLRGLWIHNNWLGWVYYFYNLSWYWIMCYTDKHFYIM